MYWIGCNGFLHCAYYKMNHLPKTYFSSVLILDSLQITIPVLPFCLCNSLSFPSCSLKSDIIKYVIYIADPFMHEVRIWLSGKTNVSNQRQQWKGKSGQFKVKHWYTLCIFLLIIHAKVWWWWWIISRNTLYSHILLLSTVDERRVAFFWCIPELTIWCHQKDNIFLQLSTLQYESVDYGSFYQVSGW